jgi:hypothetical protein
MWLRPVPLRRCIGVGLALVTLLMEPEALLAQDRNSGRPTTPAGTRVALIIGNSDYKSAPLGKSRQRCQRPGQCPGKAGFQRIGARKRRRTRTQGGGGCLCQTPEAGRYRPVLFRRPRHSAEGPEFPAAGGCRLRQRGRRQFQVGQCGICPFAHGRGGEPDQHRDSRCLSQQSAPAVAQVHQQGPRRDERRPRRKGHLHCVCDVAGLHGGGRHAGATASTQNICCARWKPRTPTSTGFSAGCAQAWCRIRTASRCHGPQAPSLGLSISAWPRIWRPCSDRATQPAVSARHEAAAEAATAPYDPVQERAHWERIKESRVAADFVGYLEKFSGRKGRPMPAGWYQVWRHGGARRRRAPRSGRARRRPNGWRWRRRSLPTPAAPVAVPLSGCHSLARHGDS